MHHSQPYRDIRRNEAFGTYAGRETIERDVDRPFEPAEWQERFDALINAPFGSQAALDAIQEINAAMAVRPQ